MSRQNQFLYEQLDTLSKFRKLTKEIPDYLKNNLNSKFELRPYQIEAFARLSYCINKDFPGKKYPLHLLFNMATGSGKTLIMAGLILYLYEKGHRNFLFFVNSTNIIEKTKENFLNPRSSKFLFKENMQVGTKRVNVASVTNFEDVNQNDINICFTTIQKLHSNLTISKENSITLEDFRKHEIVLIADEAHHMNVGTKSQKQKYLFENWENTVEAIFKQNKNNLLLEFTATHDYETPEMVEKYRDKVITHYDLKDFRRDRFSKDVIVIRSDFKMNDRILQAMILSEYKQEVAGKHNINLKPVILFKAQRTIKQSRENKANFHELVDDITANHISGIRTSTIPVIRRAFLFFNNNGIDDEQLAMRLKRSFQKDYCISVNDDKEKENYQIRVNTLEDKDNRIRAIFAVQKLNEGWDVLNLFDIVRCYEQRDSGKSKIGKTTMSEAQLIGRGARYFPFVLPENSDRFRRKFDNDVENELRVLEELHYHSINDSRYISEIHEAMINEGIKDAKEINKPLRLKDSFKETGLYKNGYVYSNEKIKNNYQNVRSISEIGVRKKDYEHKIASGRGTSSSLFDNDHAEDVKCDTKNIKISDIPSHIVRNAISRQSFFSFKTIKKYFPHVGSVRQFAEKEDYLSGLTIKFIGDFSNGLSNKDQMDAVIGLLNQIESEVREKTIKYKGTKEFTPHSVSLVFSDKTLKLSEGTERADGDEQFLSDKDWYVFNANYGTDQEKEFVKMIDSEMKTLREQYDEIYLIRNERHFRIYNFSNGNAFEPDFILFLLERNGDTFTYQIFVEPKGKHLLEQDKWKQEFLDEISDKSEMIRIENQEYGLVGVPFYNSEDENEFKQNFYERIKETKSRNKNKKFR